MLTNLITYNKDGRTARNEYYNSDTGIIENLDNWEYDEYGYGTRELIESYIDGNLLSQDIKSYEYVRELKEMSLSEMIIMNVYIMNKIMTIAAILSSLPWLVRNVMIESWNVDMIWHMMKKEIK